MTRKTQTAPQIDGPHHSCQPCTICSECDWHSYTQRLSSHLISRRSILPPTHQHRPEQPGPLVCRILPAGPAQVVRELVGTGFWTPSRGSSQFYPQTCSTDIHRQQGIQNGFPKKLLVEGSSGQLLATDTISVFQVGAQRSGRRERQIGSCGLCSEAVSPWRSDAPMFKRQRR
jgi:hypothetical protein